MELPYDDSSTMIPYPKKFVQSSEMSLETRSRAPKIGEHNLEIYNEIGLSGSDLITLKEAGVI